MKKSVISCGFLMLAFISCGFQTNQEPTKYSEQSLGISKLENPVFKITANGLFTKKQPLAIVTEVGSPIETNVSITWNSPTLVNLSQKSSEVHLNAGETKRITITAIPERRGFFSVDGQAMPSVVWGDKPELGRSVFFNVAAETNTRSSEQAGITTMETHLETLPEAEPGLYQKQELDRLNGTDIAPLEVHQLNPTYTTILPNTKPSEKDTETVTIPGEFISVYLPHTGDGKPEEGELTGQHPTETPKTKAERQTRNLFCDGSHTSTVKVVMQSPSYSGTNGYGSYNLTHTWVRVSDTNGSSKVTIAYGYTDSNGVFTFVKPNCDTESWWDWSPPDISYEIWSDTDTGLITRVSRGIIRGTQAQVLTGTYWEDRSVDTKINIYAPDAVHTRILFTSNVMIQKARELNELAGHTNISTFPLRVNEEGFPTFAPVGVIFFGNATNSTTFESGSDSSFGGYASPYMIYHEFGHEIMWATRNPNFYQTLFYDNLPIASPGYEDDKCIRTLPNGSPDLNGAISDLSSGILVPCFIAAYSHNGDLLYDEKLAWAEGWANYFNNIALLYFYKNDRESIYKTYLTNNSQYIQRHLYCGHPVVPNPSSGVSSLFSCNAQFEKFEQPNPLVAGKVVTRGTLNETRVGTFLTRFTIEILAGIQQPSRNSGAIGLSSWIDGLSPYQVSQILSQYGRVRNALLSTNGYLMGLNNKWGQLYALASQDLYTKTKICEIAFDSRVIEPNTPLPCNENGTAK